MLVERGAEPAIRLFNSDGSEPELSGNGTRCAAALLVWRGLTGETVRVQTGAGPKELKLLSRSGLEFRFEMNMGSPEVTAEHIHLETQTGGFEATLVRAGNPQCAILVDNFDFEWQSAGAEIERMPMFPNRTNVSFMRRVDDHTIDVRFWERGAGATMSSGTGATGAVAAALRLGIARSPVRVLTPAGPIDLRWDGDAYLVGPAEIVASGEFYMRE
jgi:diaminopimelate epimerase